MEKKIEMIVGERVVRVMPHMVEDLLLHGATKVKKVIKEIPKELLTIPSKDPLPQMEFKEPEIVSEIKAEVKQEVKAQVRTEVKPKTRRKK